MKDSSKTKAQLLNELMELRQRVTALETAEIERRPAEVALAQERNLLRILIDNVPNYIFIKDTERRYVANNIAHLRSLGVQDPAQAIGKTVFDFHPPDLAAQYDADERQVIQSGQPLLNKEEHYLDLALGERRWHHTNKVPLRDSHGQIIGLVGICQDITERKQAEKELQTKSRQQEQLFQTAHQLTASLDVTEVLTRIGVTAKEILHAHGCAIYLLEADGKTLTPMAAIEPPYEQEILATPLHVETSFTGQAVKARQGLIFNEAADDFSGQQIPGTPPEPKECVITAPFIADDQVLGAMCLNRIGIPFSDQDLALAETFATYAAIALKNAQAHHNLECEVEKRKQAENALRQSEALFQSLIESLPQNIFSKDLEGRLTYANQRYCATEGKSLEDILGKTDVDIHPSQLAHKYQKDDRTVIETGQILEVMEEHQPLGGDKFYVQVIKAPLHNPAGLVTGVLGIFWDITERRQMELKLRESEKKFRTLVEQIAAVSYIHVADETGSAIYISPQVKPMLGYSPEEWLQTPALWIKLLHPQDREQVVAEHTRTNATGEPFRMDYRLIARDGRGVWVHDEAVLLRDETGQPHSWQGVMHDITERKKMEDTLRRERELFLAGPVVVWQQAGQDPLSKEFVSENISQFGYQAQDFINGQKNYADIIHPHDRERVLAEVEEYNESGVNRYKQEYRIVCADGRTRWVHDYSTISRDKLGNMTSFDWYMLDITERRQAEEQIQKLNQSLARRARELAALNKASRAMASSLNLKGVLETVIVEVRRLLDAEGASVLLREPALAGDELVFAASDSPGAEKLIGTRMPATAGIAGAVLQERQSARVDNAQNDPRFYKQVDATTGLTTRSLLAVPLVFKGQVRGVIEAVNKASGAFDEHDLELLEAMAGSAVTAIENARLYQAEREQYNRLQASQTRLIQAEKMEALGRLIASIAHEINNPLQAVLGCLELFREELDDHARREKLQRYLGIVETETERIATIVRRVRDFYRPARREMQPTDVHVVLGGVLELAGKQLQHHNIVTEREWAEDLPLIQANSDHLKQVFLNLVLNAIDAIPERGGTLRIRTASDQMPGADNRLLPAVRVEFSDTGAGMSPEVVAHLFEPFFTTKTGGTGLGLAVSYEIIQAHSGQISVKSQKGIGTTFTILLPVERP